MNSLKDLAQFIYGEANKEIASMSQAHPAEATDTYIRGVFERWYEASKVLHKTDGLTIPNSAEFIDKLVQKFEATEQFAHPHGFAYQDEGWRPWLDLRKNDKKDRIDWFYWRRYRDYLQGEKRWSRETVESMDVDTDAILDRMADPHREDDFDKRGLVVASVQSGKTANYIGLMAKAADAGYNIIIVLAGIYNVLRNQTQVRIEEGFIGLDKTTGKKVGVGLGNSEKTPIAGTSRVQDFNKNAEKTLSGLKSRHVDVPIVFVLKKNVNSLREIILWLRQNCKSTDSLLLIDDEADNASINVSYSKDEISRINGQIRDILSIFPKSCYVGYTATPFANVLIDPSAFDDEKGTDIFPRSFIYTLEQSDAYFGAEKVFADATQKRPAYLRFITDPPTKVDDRGKEVNYRNGDALEFLPESLKSAMRTFVVACALRILDGDSDEHMSMMVNLSPFNSIQRSTRNLAKDYLQELVYDINSYAGLPGTIALNSSPILRDLHNTWQQEYSEEKYDWQAVQSKLYDAVLPMHVVEINSKSQDALDYTHATQRVIAIGGYRLSRGLTLEGLMVSYYARNARAYDSLMQMARWFGYRVGYEQYCRIWMTRQSAEWYSFVAEATQDLIDEVRRMCTASSTPDQYGLAIRMYPETLLVTARNKQGAGREGEKSVDFNGKSRQVTAINRAPKELEYNEKQALDFLMRLEREGYPSERKGGGVLYRDIPSLCVVGYLNKYHDSDHSNTYGQMPLLMRHIDKLDEHGCDKWFVYVASGSAVSTKKFEYAGYTIPRERRTSGTGTDKDYFIVRNSMLASRGVEKVMLTPEQEGRAVEEAHKVKPNKFVTSADYLSQATNPILVLHPLELIINNDTGDSQNQDTDEEQETVSSADAVEYTVAWSIGFPPREDIEPESGYMINDVLYRQQQSVEDDESEEARPDD